MLIIGWFYFVAIFAGFFALNDPVDRRPDMQYLPPEIGGKLGAFRLFDTEGRFRPVIYRVTSKLNFQTFSRDFFPVPESETPLRLFVRGDPYTLLFFIETDVHLLATGSDEARWFPLGTDGSGRCLYSRMVHGSTLSLSIGILAIVITWVLGIVIGGISGYFGGAVDTVIQRIIEVLLAFPTIPLWMALSASLPLHWSIIQVYFAITVIVSIIGWTGLARLVRSRFLALREEEFTLAAKLDGASTPRLLFRHMLPSFYSHLIVEGSNRIPGHDPGGDGAQLPGPGPAGAGDQLGRAAGRVAERDVDRHPPVAAAAGAAGDRDRGGLPVSGRRPARRRRPLPVTPCSPSSRGAC